MVAAITGILMGLGTLISYGGYNIFNSLTSNNSSAANTTVIQSNQSTNTTDVKAIPLNIIKNFEENLEFLEIENTSLKNNMSSISTLQNTLNKVTLNKIKTQFELNNIHNDVELVESDMLMGRELDPTENLNLIDPKENLYVKVQNAATTFDVGYNPNDPVYQEQELDNTGSPERLNPKLTLNINSNKNTLEKSEINSNKNVLEKSEINSNKNGLEKSDDTQKTFEFEPFPSLKRKLDNERELDDIPDNPLYKTHYETEHEVEVKNPLYPIPKNNKSQHQEIEFEPFPSLKRKLDNERKIDDIPDNPLYKTHYETEHEVEVKNPLYPIPKKNRNQHQENILHLNEIGSQSYDKINPKLALKINKNINSKEDETKDNEINSVENHILESNFNIPEAKSLINEDLAGEDLNPVIVDLIDSLVSKKESENMEREILKEEEVIIKSFLGNEVGSEEMNVKTLLISYAEIAGIVVASVLIVTGLIFLSIRQAMKYRRQSKIKQRYAENETGRVNTLTYAYTNDVET